MKNMKLSLKKIENGRWIHKVKNAWISKTNTFGPKRKWVPKSLLIPSDLSV